MLLNFSKALFVCTTTGLSGTFTTSSESMCSTPSTPSSIVFINEFQSSLKPNSINISLDIPAILLPTFLSSPLPQKLINAIALSLYSYLLSIFKVFTIADIFNTASPKSGLFLFTK
jgi:hypothetical protein